MDKNNKRLVLVYFDRYDELKRCTNNESLFIEAEKIIPKYFTWKCKKEFESFPKIDLEFIMLFLKKNLMNEKNTWSITKTDTFAEKSGLRGHELASRLFDFF